MAGEKQRDHGEGDVAGLRAWAAVAVRQAHEVWPHARKNPQLAELRLVTEHLDTVLWLALRCAEDRRPAEAVEALELGRALVLQTAAAAHGVPRLLADRGHSDLAERWRAQAPWHPLQPGPREGDRVEGVAGEGCAVEGFAGEGRPAEGDAGEGRPAEGEAGEGRRAEGDPLRPSRAAAEAAPAPRR